ncbi:hypothetical protein ACFWCB_11850 [Streptomyces sp. NPDC060048]|uniref:hypothetical protein n=1 Tax=unclassified Streptomyces TaxID=2593676 RepID=UPI0036970387
MSAERAQGRGWARIPASRAEQPGTARAAPAHPGAPYASAPYASAPYPHPGYPYPAYPQAPYDPSTIYLALVERWREAGRTLPGHPDEEWERLISQPCWPGR